MSKIKKIWPTCGHCCRNNENCVLNYYLTITCTAYVKPRKCVGRTVRSCVASARCGREAVALRRIRRRRRRRRHRRQVARRRGLALDLPAPKPSQRSRKSVQICQIANWQANFAKFCKFLAGSFSAKSKRNFASKYAFDSIFQALQDLHPFAPLQSQNFRKKSV